MLTQNFIFGSHAIYSTLDDQGMTWWSFDDVCSALDLEDEGRLYDSLPPSHKGWGSFSTDKGHRRINMISEIALYQLLLESKAMHKKTFRRFMARRVFADLVKAFH